MKAQQRSKGTLLRQALDFRLTITHSREKFVPHRVVPHALPPKGAAYTRTDAHFDGTTTQKQDYLPWAVRPAESKKPKAAYIENPGECNDI